MTDFLQSIKSDLLSRRMLPFLAVLGVALIAAVGYALTAGGTSGSTAAVSASLPSAPTGSAAGPTQLSVAGEDPHQAVSETPGGVRYQSQGPTRDPFIPLPSPPEAKSAGTGGSSSSKASSSSGPSSSGSSGSGAKGSGPTGTPAPTPKKPSKPSKPVSPYAVSVQLGLASTTPGQPATLTPYDNLTPQQPLPSKQDVRVSFERVTSTGKGAVFKLVVAPILHGAGTCLPSTSECQTIDLEVGQSEELEYVEANGQTVVYELKVLAIAQKSGEASAARVRHKAHTSRAKRN